MDIPQAILPFRQRHRGVAGRSKRIEGKTAVLTLVLVISFAASAVAKGGRSSSAASSAAAATGAVSAGRIAAGGPSAPAGGGSTRSTGGGMHGIYQPAPELDPRRKISEQNCTKPIVNDGGNLRCK